MEGAWAPIVAALVSVVTMLLITEGLAKFQRLQELAFGIAILVGMFVTQAIFG